MRQTITIPGRLPGMNEYSGACRTNAYKAAKMKRDAQSKVIAAAKGARKMKAPVDVNIIFIEPNMRRDKDNIGTGWKFILDGLVQAGVIENDNWKWIRNITPDFKLNRTNPRIIVELEEVEE